jgi:ribosomal protein L20
MPKESSKDSLEKEEGSYKRRSRKYRARKNGLLEADVYAYKEGSLRISF